MCCCALTLLSSVHTKLLTGAIALQALTMLAETPEGKAELQSALPKVIIILVPVRGVTEFIYALFYAHLVSLLFLLLQLEELINETNEMVSKAARTAKKVITWKP